MDEFRSKLLTWYDAHARDLPWRQDRHPYRIWISEIMLQQTRVAAVIAHYREFLRRFPTVQRLAAAREATVLAIWSGLGYYRRARMLHEAARVMVRQLRGEFPQSAAQWRELPGIGRYTAAAIASIAFREPVAVVDGNVERVLQRIANKSMAGAEVWQTAEDFLDRARPGDFNQALMELGATVCTPRNPMCLTCPVMSLCATRGELPRQQGPVRQNKREIHYALNHCDEKVLLVQRRRDAKLMADMWELPEIRRPNSHAKPALTVRHSITVTDYVVRIWRQPAPEQNSGKWVATSRLPDIALTGLTRKILRKTGLLAMDANGR